MSIGSKLNRVFLLNDVEKNELIKTIKNLVKDFDKTLLSLNEVKK